MVASFDQAFHSNNSNVDKHINTRKLSIKQSPLFRPFYLTCTNLMRHEKNKQKKHFQQKISRQFTGEAAQYYVESNNSDILQWISKKENVNTKIYQYGLWLCSCLEINLNQ